MPNICGILWQQRKGEVFCRKIHATLESIWFRVFQKKELFDKNFYSTFDIFNGEKILANKITFQF